MKRWLRPGWLVVYFVVVLGWAAWYVPRLNAERYREKIHAGLESALGRKVSFGSLQFQLLPVPGFTIKDLIIGEDPAIGPEPAAYITTLRGRPRLAALLGGPLEFASVDLEETSLNLTRAEGDVSAVRWNFSSLTRSHLKASFPVIHMIGGRVNFKFGDTKTVFYLLNTDADLWPPSDEGGPWTMKVQAEPARTDRPSHGFGRFVARGEWRPRDGAITIDLKLEKSELSDIATLFQGSESGLHGLIWGDAHLAGPAERVGIAGRMSIDDIHGWNQPPNRASRPLALVLSGALDVRNQTLDMRANSGVQEIPLDLRYRVQDFLGHPRWGLTALLAGMPLAPLADTARHLGWAIPEDMKVEGTARGVLGYSIGLNSPADENSGRFNGGLSFTGVKAVSSSGATLLLADTALTVTGAKAVLAPAVLTASNGETATLDAAIDSVTSSFELGLKTDGMAVETLRPLLAGSQIPLLSHVTGGTWSGAVRLAGNPGVWTGELRVRDAALRFDAFAEPVQLTAAEAQLERDSMNIRRLSLRAGGMDVQGEYRYEYGVAVPHQFHLTAATADGLTLEKLFEPVLNRAGILNKTLNFGKVPVPEWLHNLHAGGTLQVGNLTLGTLVLSRLKTRVEWNAETGTFSGMTAQLGTSVLSGDGKLEVTGAQPAYAFEGKATGVAWRGGLIDAQGTAGTSGVGGDLLSHLAMKGSFNARNLDLAPLRRFPTAQGQFELSWGKNGPSLKLSPLTATADGAAWQGTAETRENGEVVLKLTSGDRAIQASGAVLQGEGFKPLPAGR